MYTAISGPLDTTFYPCNFFHFSSSKQSFPQTEMLGGQADNFPVAFLFLSLPPRALVGREIFSCRIPFLGGPCRCSGTADVPPPPARTSLSSTLQTAWSLTAAPVQIDPEWGHCPGRCSACGHRILRGGGDHRHRLRHWQYPDEHSTVDEGARVNASQCVWRPHAPHNNISKKKKVLR